MLFSSIQFIANALLIIYHNKSSQLQERCYTRCMNQLLRMCSTTTYYSCLETTRTQKVFFQIQKKTKKTLLIINYLQINCALFLLHNHSSFFSDTVFTILPFCIYLYLKFGQSLWCCQPASQLASSCLYAMKPQLVDESISLPLSQFTAVVLFYFA